ncbi:MAG: FtsW/RodA/SpoVE family cell cycle protein [Coriobacteriales bacterium]|nr:FtsW/RodA/SpoVE family cell cycle protein [Coriobacteriales bacterium]
MAVTPKIEKAQTASASRISSILGKVNLPFFGVIAALLIFGILNLSYVLAGSTEYSLMRQVMGIGLGIVGMAVCWKIDYRIFEHMIIPLLIIDIVLILSPHLPIIGYSAGGATSWVKIGIRFQPAELAKLVTILLMAAVVARYQGRIDSPKEYLKCIGFLCVPFICIMTQPDLGTGLVLIIIGATIIFVGGANKKLLLITIGLMAAFIAFIFIADPILDNIAGKDVFLKDYQLNRILVFLNEDADPTGAGYNLKQAKIAIG